LIVAFHLIFKKMARARARASARDRERKRARERAIARARVMARTRVRARGRARARAYLVADVRRNGRKMGGFASWEIFGTGFEILIFLWFSHDVQILKLWFSRGFPQFLGGSQKFSKCGFSRSVLGF
jgi:hypothetical protein